MLRRVLVANRGEIAVRVIRAAHELGMEAVAVYSTADEEALHVRLADRAVRIGPAPAARSYLSIPSVVAAAKTTECDCVHPGYGFLAENPAFVEACEQNDLVFVGPGADVMQRMGDKVQAKAELKAAAVPVVPGTEGSTTMAEAVSLAGELGYPVLLKATAGGGGKGMRLVDDAGELESAFQTASAEAFAAFGDGSLYVRGIALARHVEIQGCSATDRAACSRSGSARCRPRPRSPPRPGRRWRRRPSAPATRSVTAARARSSSSLAPTAPFPSSS